MPNPQDTVYWLLANRQAALEQQQADALGAAQTGHKNAAEALSFEEREYGRRRGEAEAFGKTSPDAPPTLQTPRLTEIAQMGANEELRRREEWDQRQLVEKQKRELDRYKFEQREAAVKARHEALLPVRQKTAEASMITANAKAEFSRKYWPYLGSGREQSPEAQRKLDKMLDSLDKEEQRLRTDKAGMLVSEDPTDPTAPPRTYHTPEVSTALERTQQRRNAVLRLKAQRELDADDYAELAKLFEEQQQIETQGIQPGRSVFAK